MSSLAAAASTRRPTWSLSATGPKLLRLGPLSDVGISAYRRPQLGCVNLSIMVVMFVIGAQPAACPTAKARHSRTTALATTLAVTFTLALSPSARL